MSSLVDAFDAEFGDELNLKHAIIDILESTSVETPRARMVDEETLFQVAERALEFYSDFDSDVKFFNTLREVNNFITLATQGITASGSAKHADLLPISNPYSKKQADLSFDTVRSLQAEWLAADPRIASDEARAIVAAVYASNPFSIERTYHLTRLQALGEGQVPSDLLITPLLAFGDPYAGKNSFWHRAMRANKQRRDDEGQFAEMGGGVRFYGRLPNGRLLSIVGKIAGLPENDPEGIDVEVTDVKGLKNGIYTIPSNISHTFKAILPEHAIAKYIDVPPGKNVQYIDLATLRRKDFPTSWFESRSSVEVPGIDKMAPKKTYATGDGYRANYFENENEGRAIAKRVSDAREIFNSQVISSSGTDTLSPDFPVYELISTKRGQTEVVGYAQDWASVQKLANEEDTAYPEAENEPLPEVDRGPSPVPLDRMAPKDEEAPKPEEVDEDVENAFVSDPRANKPKNWIENLPNVFIDPYSGYQARFGRALFTISDTGEPVHLDNVFEVTDFATNETIGVVFNWDGVEELVTAIRSNPTEIPDNDLDRISPKREDLTPGREELVAMSEKDLSIKGATDPISAALFSTLHKKYDQKELTPEMVDIFDEMATSRDNFITQQARKLLGIFNKQPDRAESRGNETSYGKLSAARRQIIRDLLAVVNFPDNGIKIGGKEGVSKNQVADNYRNLSFDLLQDTIDVLNFLKDGVGSPTGFDVHELLTPTEEDKNAIRLVGEDPDAPVTGSRFTALRKLLFANPNHSPEMRRAYDAIRDNREDYTNAEARRLFYLINGTKPSEDVSTPVDNGKPSGPTSPAESKVGQRGRITPAQKSLIEKLLSRVGNALPEEKLNSIRSSYLGYWAREASNTITELQKAIGAAPNSSANSSSTAITATTANLKPNYLFTNMTQEGFIPSDAMLAMIEFLFENKDISADEISRLTNIIPNQPRKIIKEMIDTLQALPNRKKYSAVGVLSSNLPEGGKTTPTPRMLRALERMRFRNLISDAAEWEDMVKAIPDMTREEVSTKYLDKYKEIENAHDKHILEQSIKKGYEVEGLRNGAEGKRLVEIPEGYTPKFPGKWLGPTEEEINKALEAGAPIEAVNVIVSTPDEDSIIVNDEFLAGQALRADLARLRAGIRSVFSVFADFYELMPDRLSVGARKILQAANNDLNVIHYTMHLGRRNPLLTPRELNDRLEQIAEGLLTIRTDAPGIYGTLKSKKASDRDALARAKSAVLDLVGLYKAGIFAGTPEDQNLASEIDKMVSIPTQVDKPRSPYVDPPTFAGPAFDVLKGATTWDDVVSLLKASEFYIIDFETTGLVDLDDPEIKNDPIQIAISKVKNLQVVDVFSTYINPESKLSAYTLNGVGDGQGGKVTPEFLSKFPTKKEVMQQVMDFIPQGSIIGGHNFYVFDKEVLDRTMKQAGLDGLNSSGYIDTLGLARHMMPKWSPENPDAPYKVVNGQQRAAHTLESLVTYFGLSNNGRHEADADVASTVDVLNRMLDRAQRGLALTGKEFSYDKSLNGWDQEKYDSAITEYQDRAVAYWISRYKRILSLQGLDPQEIENQMFSDFKSMNDNLTISSDNREAIITPVPATIKNLPGGTYAYNISDGRIGQVVGLIPGGNLLVNYAAVGGERAQKFNLEQTPAQMLSPVTNRYLSRNGVLLDYGMNVNEGSSDQVARVLGFSPNVGEVILSYAENVYLKKAANLIVLESSNLDGANQEHYSTILSLVDQLLFKKGITSEIAEAYKSAVKTKAYSTNAANGLIVRLKNAIDQFDLLDANSDIADSLPQGGFPAGKPEIDKMAARRSKKNVVPSITDLPDLFSEIEKELDLPYPPTDEGRQIINAILNEKSVSAEAYAGVGKTSLAVILSSAYKKLNPKAKILNLVFGKETQLDAERRMPKFVESRTSDSVSKSTDANKTMSARFDEQPKLTASYQARVNLRIPGALMDFFGFFESNDANIDMSDKDYQVAMSKENRLAAVARLIGTEDPEAISEWLKKATKSDMRELFDEIYVAHQLLNPGTPKLPTLPQRLDTPSGFPKNAPRLTAERILVSAFRNWLLSSDAAPNVRHIDMIEEMGDYAPENYEDYFFYTDLIGRMWKDATDSLDTEGPQLQIDFNMMTKNWALTHPNLKEIKSDNKSPNGIRSGAPDLIILDEAQDINEVLGGILADQQDLHNADIKFLIIGDRNQSMYRFRGTVNAFEIIKTDYKLPLTQSWRFGPELAKIANKILKFLGNDKDLTGNPKKTTEILEPGTMLDPDLLLTRTNAGIVEALYEFRILQGESVIFGTTINFKKRILENMKALKWLRYGANPQYRPKVIPPELANFLTWDMFLAAASQDKELKVYRNLIYQVKSTSRLKKDSEAIEEIIAMVEKLSLQRQTFKSPATIESEGSIGGNISFEKVKDKVILSNSRFNNQYGSGVWDNKAILERLGYEKEDFEYAPGKTTTRFAKNVEANFEKQLQKLVSILNGEDIAIRFMTAHSAKGLEGKRVKLWRDYFDPRESADARNKAFTEDELDIAYVAITRAEDALDPGKLDWVATGDLEKLSTHVFADEGGDAAPQQAEIDRMSSKISVDDAYKKQTQREIESARSSIEYEKKQLALPVAKRQNNATDFELNEIISSAEERIKKMEQNPLFQKQLDEDLVSQFEDLKRAAFDGSLTEDQVDFLIENRIMGMPRSDDRPTAKIAFIDKLTERFIEASNRLAGGPLSAIDKMSSSGGDNVDLDDPEESVPTTEDPVDDTILSGYRSDNQKFAEQMGQQMVDAIKKTKKLPWQKPWSAEGTLPTSGATGKVYRRFNLLWLNMVSEWYGYKGTRWYTENNIKKLGGYLDADARGHTIAYVQTVKKKETQKTLIPDPSDSSKTIEKTEEVDKSYAKIGSYMVYNEDFIRGITLPPAIVRDPVSALEAEQILFDSYKDHPPVINRKIDRGYWSPVDDEIHLAQRDMFASAEAYFSTLAHEFTHSTNHPDRLNNRKDAMENYGTHIESRAREELVAEIGAAMLSQIFNVEVTYDNSVSYVESWLEALENDPAMVMEAATLSGQAVEYMLGGYWLSIEKGLVEADSSPDYVPAEAIGAATGEISGIDGEFNGLGGGVNYRIEGNQVILLGNTKAFKDEIKSSSVDNNGRQFKFFWHGKSGTWRVSFAGDDADGKRIEILKDLRDRIAQKGSEGTAESTIDKMAAKVAGEDNDPLKERIYAVNQATADYYHNNFMTASAYSPAVKYFLGRGLKKEDAVKFQVGRVIGQTKGGGWNSLIKHLTEKGFSQEEIIASGVVGSSEKNNLLYDALVIGSTGDDRIVFPIKDADGRVVSFVGRSINDQDNAKYAFAKTSPVFSKGNALFGIDVARKGIESRNQVIFVEGQMDVLAMHAAGIDNAVATSGTEFSKGHLNIINSLVSKNDNQAEIVFFFDPDNAGQNAAIKAFKTTQDSGHYITKVSSRKTGGMDPAEIYKTGGSDALRSVLSGRASLESTVMMDAFIPYAYGERTEENLNNLVGMIAAINSPSVREEYMRLYAESLGMSYNELKQLVDAAIQRR